MNTPLSPEAVAQLVADLRDGVHSMGMHEDNNTELFDVEGAGDTMFAAADMLTTIAAENATLRASEAAALKSLAEIGVVVAALEGKDSLDREMIRNIGMRIAALTPDQHDALAAHVAAEVAKARAEDAALRDAARPLLNMAMWTESAEDTEVVIVTVGTVRAIRNAIAQIGAKP